MPRSRSLTARIGVGAAVLLVSAWSFLPIYWMLLSSLRAPSQLFRDPSLIPAWPLSLESYRELLGTTDYLQQFANSVIVALCVVAITLAISIVVAYTITRYRMPGKSMLVSSMLFAYMFPPLLLAIPLLSIFASVGLSDTLFAVIVAHCTLTLPLGIWLFWGFFKAMPFELEEAAMVDGCTRIGAFVSVVLPLSLPGVVTVAIFSFLLSWTDYIFAFVLLSSDDQKTLPVGLASVLGTFDVRWGEVMAGATLIALPLFVMFVFLSRYFIQGLAAGATKG